MILHPCFDTNEKGHLTIGGMDAVDLAREFGTPAYIMDEETIRRSCRAYKHALDDAFADGSMPMYASKALSCMEIYRIMASEGIGVDCVSPGELYTASRAGFPMENVCFHGNNKTRDDLRLALELGVGYIVVDHMTELRLLDTLAGERGTVQTILLRITPGIDPHTHKKIRTGAVDSKFGSAIATGQADEIVGAALKCPNLHLAGLHCHVGSQIFDLDPFASAADIMLHYIARVKETFGAEMEFLNLGGGIGVRYTEDDPSIDYREYLAQITGEIQKLSCDLGIKRPKIMLEPGRSIVAAAGATLYTVGAVKEIPGFKNYVSVDGGMPDNPRYALYQSAYTALVANRAAAPKDYVCTLAGRCCESGDLLGEDMVLQRPQPDDILAVLVTGAYNYSMASNYNRIARAPIVMVRDGRARVAVQRESFEDLIRNDR